MTTPPENVPALHQRIQTLERMIAEREQVERELHDRLHEHEHAQQQIEGELRQFKEIAENAIQTRSDFLTNMSHKIRTPLNAVMAMTDLLLESDLDNQQREFVEMIQAGGSSLVAMLNDILDFSRIESDRLQLEHHPFNLRSCVEESLDVLSPRAAEKQIDLIYNVDDQTPNTLVGDAGRLRQILTHLLSNAIKFTDRGEVVVLITSRPIEESSDTIEERGDTSPSDRRQHKLLITVRDTGIGMSQETINTIFQPFNQIESTMTRKYGGSGLGLMICKRLVEMMGGTILVKSQVGKGTTLHITIVAEAVAASEETSISEIGTQHGVPTTASTPQLVGKRVLVVDDNATSRSILSRRLHTWGMVPLAATSGPEAMEWVLRGESFDVALIDLHMPQMDGMTLAARIRLHLDTESLPIVLITAFSGEVVRSADVQIAAFLTRPIKPTTLYHTLINVVSERATVAPDTIEPQTTVESRKPEGADPQMAEQIPLRILLAEDNRINQKVALSLLKRLGYRADVATDGLEVLESLARQTYDIVLMDVQMPEMDGVQATQHIRRFLPAEKQPRIAAMTAHALQGDREHYLAQGMDDYISKPVKLQDLVAVLSKTAQQHQSTQPHTETADEVLVPPHAALEALPSATPAPVSTTPGKESFPLDVAVLEQFLGEIRSLAPQLADELIDTLLQETPRTLRVMHQAVQEDDAETLYNAAHGFKPHCTQFGAMTMMMLCQELETISRSGSLSGAVERVEQLEQEYALVKDALEAMQARDMQAD